MFGNSQVETKQPTVPWSLTPFVLNMHLEKGRNLAAGCYATATEEL